MVYYPLSVLMLSGIREIMIISTLDDLPKFENLLGDGSQFGCSFQYMVQPSPDGLAQAFILAEQFIGNDTVSLILGDNIFHSAGFTRLLNESIEPDGGIIFGIQVPDPQRYGVVEFDKDMKALGLEEKPANPKSSYAVPGLYFYDNSVIEIAHTITPSARGELEITDVNKRYLEKNKLKVVPLPRGAAWYDCGTFDSLKRAGNYIEAMERDHNLLIGSPEEIAWRKGFIDDVQLQKLAASLSKSGYGQKLLDVLNHSY